MNDQVNPQPPDGRGLPLRDQMEFLKFLREESEANRRAQRDEAESNRRLLTDAFKIVSPVLAVVIALAGFLWFHDLATLKEAIRNEAEVEAKAEIKRMDEHIDGTLQARFQKEEIQKTIQRAAEAAAQKEARPLIEAGVKSQVREAVAQQGGMIRKIAEQAVSSEVRETIEPLANKVGESIAELHTNEVIARVNADDAQAFDELLELKESGPASQRRLVDGVITDRHNHALDQFRADGQNPARCAVPDPIGLGSYKVSDRIQAIADCSGWFGGEFYSPRWDRAALLNIEATVTPHIVEVALNDHSLAVRSAAIYYINSAFAHIPAFKGFDVLDNRGLRDWWNENKPNYYALELLSRAWSGPDDRDLAGLYIELSRAAASSPPALRDTLEKELAEMRKAAALRQDPPSGLKQKLGRDNCVDVGNDFGLRKLDDSDSYSFLEIEYLQNCPIVRTYLPRIADYAISSQLLTRRYAATMVVNDWVSEKFDPFDPKGLRDWWADHKTEYQK
jgi:hypothetical protein